MKYFIIKISILLFLSSCYFFNSKIELPVEYISLNTKQLTVILNGEEQLLEYEVYPLTATNQNVIWESSDETIAIVQNGKILPQSQGDIVITLKTIDGKHRDSCAVSVRGTSLYSIGNSHTWDFRPSSDFLQIGRSQKVMIKNGWHINCGKNLYHIWNNPEQTCIESNEFGNFKNAIDNYKWNAIMIQPFVGGSAEAEKVALNEFLNLISNSINKNCNVFIYCSWPKNTSDQLSEFDYSKAWLSDFNEKDTLRIESKKFFKYLEDNYDNYSNKIEFIQVGEVFFQFDQKAKSGEIPGFTGSGELYRDAWHLNNVGRYIAGLTVFSSIFRIDLVNIPDFEAYHKSDIWPSDRELTTKQKKIMRSIISDVLHI